MAFVPLRICAFGKQSAQHGHNIVYSLGSTAHMMFEYDSSILSIIWEQEQVDPVRVGGGWQVEDDSHLDTSARSGNSDTVDK
jgi:hypothetical protein